MTTFVFDELGNVIETVDAEGLQTINQYDELNRLIRTQQVVGQPDHESDESDDILNAFAYNGAGQLVESIDGEGHRMLMEYDVRNRLVREIEIRGVLDSLGVADDPSDAVTRYEYDADDNQTRVIDAAGNSTQFEYDSRNRVIRETDPAGNSSSFIYDRIDNVIRQERRAGDAIEYVYDDVDRLVTEIWVNHDESVANEIHSSYDAVGNLMSIIDSQSVLEYTYDSRDRVTSVDNGGTADVPHVVVSYTYDGVGNVLSVSDARDGAASGTTNYSYDALNRTVGITQSGPDVVEKAIEFAYNAIGQITSITRFNDLAKSQNRVQTSYVYDDLNRISDVRHQVGGVDVAFHTLEYDLASRITSITDVDGLTNFRYDDLDQLTEADSRGEQYSYDGNGNRVSSHHHGSDYVTDAANGSCPTANSITSSIPKATSSCKPMWQPTPPASSITTIAVA